MKAYYKTSFKKNEKSQYGEIADPIAAAGQYLIEVKAVSINPVDYKLNKINTGIFPGAKLPKIVGSDFAGIVQKTAEPNSKFKVGDRVYGAVSIFTGKTGALAEYLVTDTKNMRLIPEGMSFEQAASLPVASLTALNGLRRLKISKGSKLLINGATGGVGHFAIQIAKAKGAIVTASCSEKNSELAKKLGADTTIGYKIEDAQHITAEYEAIMDAWGQMKRKDIIRLLKKDGRYASPLLLYVPNFLTQLIWFFTRRYFTSSNMRAMEEDFQEIEKLFSENKLKPIIENTFTLENAAEAFEFTENGKPRGKVIVLI